MIDVADMFVVYNKLDQLRVEGQGLIKDDDIAYRAFGFVTMLGLYLPDRMRLAFNEPRFEGLAHYPELRNLLMQIRKLAQRVINDANLLKADPNFRQGHTTFQNLIAQIDRYVASLDATRTSTPPKPQSAVSKLGPGASNQECSNAVLDDLASKAGCSTILVICLALVSVAVALQAAG